MAFSLLFYSHRQGVAQVAGLGTMQAFDLGSTARVSGLGFDYIPLYTNDIAVAIDNPSVLNSAMHRTAMLSFVPLFAGSNMGTLAYTHHWGNVGTFCFGFRFFNYGRFAGYTEEDIYEGDFGAGDYSLLVGWGMWLSDNFSVGVNFKPALSQYEQYTAITQAFDLSGSYVNTARTLMATVMARNIGAQIQTYEGRVEALPFELSAVMSYKLKGAPFRLFVAATELQTWNLAYTDPLHPTTTTDPFTGEQHSQSWFERNIDNLMRHTLVGVELSIGKKLYAQVGYSYRQAREMIGADVLNMSGFSFGIGFRAERYAISYARRNFHLSQAPNFITVSYMF